MRLESEQDVERAVDGADAVSGLLVVCLVLVIGASTLGQSPGLLPLTAVSPRPYNGLYYHQMDKIKKRLRRDEEGDGRNPRARRSRHAHAHPHSPLLVPKPTLERSRRPW